MRARKQPTSSATVDVVIADLSNDPRREKE
jgi:hypothetical protein